MIIVKKSSILTIPQFVFRISGCCYGYCEQYCYWWVKLSGLSAIDCFNCPITGVQLEPTV